MAASKCGCGSIINRKHENGVLCGAVLRINLVAQAGYEANGRKSRRTAWLLAARQKLVGWWHRVSLAAGKSRGHICSNRHLL
jgi:hypothetical protein